MGGVVVLHLLLLLAWRSAIRPQVEVPVAGAPALVWLRVAPRPVPVPPAATERTAVPAPARLEAQRPAQPAEPVAAQAPPPANPGERAEMATAAITDTITEPAAPASAPLPAPPRLLDSEATRQAIRQIGRQALLSERAAEATGLPQQRSDIQLSEAAAKAGKGDCLKGEFLGGGGGLLSLPFLAVAAVRGQCAK